MTFFAEVKLHGKGQFDMLGWLNQCQGAFFDHHILNVAFNVIKSTLKFFPTYGKCFRCSLKNTKKLRLSRKTFTWEKTVSLTCWAGLMSVGALFSLLYYECGLKGNQN